jgi:putative transposase
MGGRVWPTPSAYSPDVPMPPELSSALNTRAWVAVFVTWYNTVHLHSAIRFVTPADRHAGRRRLLQKYQRFYAVHAATRG